MKKHISDIISRIIAILKRNKKVTIIVGISLLVVIAIILLIVFKKNNSYVINNNDILPEKVKKIYTNLTDISCTGDIYFKLEANDEPTKVSSIDKKTLLSYVFSAIEKNGDIKKINLTEINKKTRELFTTYIDLTDAINNFQYDNYVYNINENKIVRKKNECKSEIKYVTFLYGYSSDKNRLSMDVNIAYQKNGILYDLKDKELGKYSGDQSKLFELTKTTSYYRLNYIEEGNTFKLDNIRLMDRS